MHFSPQSERTLCWVLCCDVRDIRHQGWAWINRISPVQLWWRGQTWQGARGTIALLHPKMPGLHEFIWYIIGQAVPTAKAWVGSRDTEWQRIYGPGCHGISRIGRSAGSSEIHFERGISIVLGLDLGWMGGAEAGEPGRFPQGGSSLKTG
jgi:hypothetical protein